MGARKTQDYLEIQKRRLIWPTPALIETRRKDQTLIPGSEVVKIHGV